jgi:hypothetical protein
MASSTLEQKNCSSLLSNSCSLQALLAGWLLQAKNPSSDATLRAIELNDPLAEQLRGNICSILDANLAGPAALLSSFAEVQQELDAAGGPGGHLVGWLAGEHSLQETAAENERLLQVRRLLLPVLVMLLCCTPALHASSQHIILL